MPSSGMMLSTYQKMLEDRFYLYRPWIAVCKSIEARVISRLKLKSPVLDIGCGNGLFATYCFKNKIDIGLDYDKNAVEEARKRDVYKEVRLGDARNLSFKDNSFNTVVSICAVEHIPELDKVLSSVRRVLRDGGKFIFTVPSEDFANFLFGSTLLRSLGLRGLAERYGDRKNQKSGHLHICSSSKWRELLKKEGLETESIDYIFPKEAVLLWSLLHSLPFKLIFLPFRLLRDFNLKVVDNILKAALGALLSTWIQEKSRTYPSGGGYLLIQARKAG